MKITKYTKITTLALTAVCAIGLIGYCADTPAEDPSTGNHTTHWDYTDPATWSTDYPTCGGTEQSPINFDNTVASGNITGGAASGVDCANYGAAQTWEYVDNGHTLQANNTNLTKATTAFPNNSNRCPQTAPENCGATNNYELLQYHFHAPSEHTVNGKEYDMEMHFVHKFVDANGGAHYGVLGILINSTSTVTTTDGQSTLTSISGTTGTNLDSLIAQIVSDLTGATVDVGVTPTDNGVADPQAVLTGISTSQGNATTLNHYNYQGSLTTPPCTEGVDEWVVITTPVTISDTTLAAFQAKYSNNARPVQPLNTRAVTSNP